MPYRELYLVMVTEENNNKFYHMIQENQNDDTFVAKYGRVNKTSTDEIYSIDKWDKKYKEKLKKGYRDLTQLRAVAGTSSTFKSLDASIADLINKLQSYSNNTVKQNYTISIGAVTPMQLQAAQDALNKAAHLYEEAKDMYELGGKYSDSVIKEINNYLLEVYTVLPRLMDNVRDHLVYEEQLPTTIARKIGNEQDILDSLSTQVNIHNIDDKDEQTLVDALGLEVELVTDFELIKAAKDMMTDSQHLFHKLYRIENKKTRQKYNNYLPEDITLWEGNQKVLFHSSRNANWLSILENGLLIRPSGVVHTGSMLGDAIYFADRAKKSIGYSSLENSYWAGGNSREAYLAIYEVYLGKSLHLQSYADLQNYRHKLNYNELGSLGYDSVFADASRGGWLYNNEYTVYHPSQCTIKYLIELKN
jgi:poly [ADP-ribose] polymerase